MKYLTSSLFVLCVLFSSIAKAQLNNPNKLPACTGTDTTIWSNYFGSESIPNRQANQEEASQVNSISSGLVPYLHTQSLCTVLGRSGYNNAIFGRELEGLCQQEGNDGELCREVSSKRLLIS